MIKIKKIAISVFLLLFIGKTLSQCDFFLEKSSEEVQIYTCSIENFTSENSELLSNAEHLDVKSNADVKSIRIHNFKMERIPKTIGILFLNLIKVEISNGNLNSLSSNDLQQFPKLEVLSIENCPDLIELDDPLLFSNNPLLTHIYFLYANLEVINYRILDGLKKLELVEIIGRCTSEWYYVASYGLENVRRDLGRKCLVSNSGYCGKLQEIDVCFLKDPKNKIDEVLQDCDYGSLKRMTISEHKNSIFPSFSSTEFQLEKLIYVSIKGNIKTIDSRELKWMPNVKELDLSNNQISSLHSNIFDYTSNLETFKIANNHLQHIGVMTFSHLKQLRNVDLSENPKFFNEIVFSKEGSMMLKSDDVKKLCEYQDSFDECVYIEETFSYVGTAFTCVAKNVNITWNLVDYYVLVEKYGFKYSPQKVEVVFIKDQICNYMPRFLSIFLKAIHIINSKLLLLDQFYFYNLPNLQSLNVGDNLITSLDPFIFKNNSNLVHIDLSNNRLMQINSHEFPVHLVSALFEGNICIDDNYEDDENVFIDASKKCPYNIDEQFNNTMLLILRSLKYRGMQPWGGGKILELNSKPAGVS